MTKCIKKANISVSNISNGELKALQELKTGTNITILPNDKGMPTLILNTKGYESKMSTLLTDTNIY